MATSLDDAVLFATKAHFGQRWHGTNLPYVAHCVDVAMIVRNSAKHHDNVLVAAVLHDTLEKTRTTPQEIAMLFGKDVLRIVLTLTNLDGNKDTPRSDLARKRLADAPADVQTIKLADLISTTPRILEGERKAAQVYLQDKAALLRILGRGNSTLLNQASELLQVGKSRFGIAA